MVFGAETTTSAQYANREKENTADNRVISIYVSSRAGDRLKRMTNTKFLPNCDTALLVMKIDESTHYQMIEGFGATFNEAGMICLNSITQNSSDQVLRSLFDSVSGAGFSLMKSPMASCDFASAGPWYSYNDTAGDTSMQYFSIKRDLGPNGLVTFIKKAKAFGRFRIETTMDFAPDWMMFGLKEGEKRVKPEYYPALAKYYSLYLQAYAANEIEIGWLNPFNESDHNWYSNVTYAEIGTLIKDHIVPRFKADGLSTRIQLCEASARQEGLDKFPVVLDDPEARKHITTLTVHGYDWDQFSTLTDLHDRYPNIPIWMTEICYALPDLIPINGPKKIPVYEFSDGEFWGNMIMNDMKHQVSAWIYWNMILDQNGGPWLVSDMHGDHDNNIEHPIVIINRKTKDVRYTGLYYYLSHFSKFIRPGAVRINCIGPAYQLNFAGFINRDNTIVVNIINNGPATRRKIMWRNKMLIQNLPEHSITTLKWMAD